MQAIDAECESLLKDSDFLQECLEGEHDYRCSMVVPKNGGAPSLQDMRALRAQLETEYFAAGADDAKRTALYGNLSPCHAQDAHCALYCPSA